jgi:hypothetical protein
MRTARSLLVAIVLLLAVATAAQITFQRIFQFHEVTNASLIQPMPDGGYVLIGHASDIPPSNNPFVIRTDSLGDTVFTVSIPFSITDGLSVGDAELLSDDGWIIVGTQYIIGDRDIFAQRTDANFDTLWTRTYGPGPDERGYGVCVTLDGGFLMSGVDFGVSNGVGYVVCTNSLGDTLWTKRYWPPSAGSWLFDAVPLPDSSFAVAGYAWLPLPDTTGPALLHLNPEGDTLWVSTFDPGTYDDCARRVLRTTDGSLVIMGWDRCFAARIDSNGNIMWFNQYSDITNGAGLHDGVELADGGFVFCGEEDGDGIIVRTDANGDSVWVRRYPGGAWNSGFTSVCITTDGGFVFAGVLLVIPFYDEAAWLLKTDSLGLLETIPPVIESTTVWTDTTFLGPYPVGSDITDNVAVDSARIYENITHDYSPPDSVVGPRYFFTVPAGPHPSGSAICYFVEAWDISQNYSIDSMYCFNVITSVQEPTSVPTEFALHAPAPNPFNPTTRISFSLPEASHVKLEIYDLLGRKVATLVDEPMDAGEHEIGWDASGFSSGVYLVRLSSDNQVATIKLVLLK